MPPNWAKKLAPFVLRPFHRISLRTHLLRLMALMGTLFIFFKIYEHYEIVRYFSATEFAGRNRRLKPAPGVKTIAFATPYFGYQWPFHYIQVKTCPGTRKCTVIDDVTKADAVVFHAPDMYPWIWTTWLKQNHRRHEQVWVYFSLEPETKVDRLSFFLNGYFNWTLTYRTDSDVYFPFFKMVRYATPRDTKRTNHAIGKTKMAYIMTGHCEVFSKRLDYVKELQNYIQVDIISQTGCGGGKNSCPRLHCEDSNLGYKFYLAFENSLCKDYITEKFWRNALMVNILPVARGAPKDDYIKVAPPHSFIHVDDFKSPKDLAEYLKVLDSDDALYNRYFEWTNNFTVEEIGTDSLCELCSALHNETMTGKEKLHVNFNDFWDVTKHCEDNGRQFGRNMFHKIWLYINYRFGVY